MSFLFIELSIGANLGKASINDDSVFSTKWPQAMGRTGTAQLIANHCLFSLPGLNTVSMLKKNLPFSRHCIQMGRRVKILADHRDQNH